MFTVLSYSHSQLEISPGPPGSFHECRVKTAVRLVPSTSAITAYCYFSARKLIEYSERRMEDRVNGVQPLAIVINTTAQNNNNNNDNTASV